MDERRFVALMTERLRGSPESGWEALRSFLRDHGVSPDEAAVAILYRDDVNLLIAIIVLSEGRLFEVELEYPQSLDEASAMSASRVVGWSDDAARISIENSDFVRTALEFLSPAD